MDERTISKGVKYLGELARAKGESERTAKAGGWDESDEVVRYGKIESLYRKKKGKKRSIPIIRLKGNWLVKLGFHEGEYVEIHAREGIIFIRPI